MAGFHLRQPAPEWKLPTRVGFRALFLYFLLYALPFPLSVAPVVRGPAFGAVGGFWRSVCPWVGANVLGLEGPMPLEFSGSGDTTFEYVKVLVIVAFTLMGTGLWTLLDGRRRHYASLARWLVVGARYYLGFIMLSYGFSKVIPVQFQRPGLLRLLQPYGESSPMGLAWTFMGSSPAYTVFAGLGEVLGGMLLFFERTRVVGAMVLIAVMTNVVALNFSYDIPVKLYSSHLLLISIALLLPDARRLVAFLRRRPVPAAPHRPLFARRWVNIVAKTIGLVLVASASYANITGALERHSLGNGRERHELYGIYDVELFMRDGEQVPPLLTDAERWRGLVIATPLPRSFGGVSRPGSIMVRHMDDTFRSHPIVLDDEEKKISILPQAAAQAADLSVFDPAGLLAYEWSAEQVLILRGTWDYTGVVITLRRRDLEKMNLLGRGFHWISERPFNR